MTVTLTLTRRMQRTTLGRVGLWSVAGALAWAGGSAKAQTPAAPASTGEAWQITQPPQSSLVFAADGSLIGEIGKQSRTSVPLASLPKYVPLAFVAVEDKRFYTTGSVDYTGKLSALKDDIVHGERRGGSTIPEQLARHHAPRPDRPEGSQRGSAVEARGGADQRRPSDG